MTELPEALSESFAGATGAQVLQAAAELRVPYPQYYDVLGLRIVRAVKDQVEMMWTPNVSLANFAGVVHGGHTAMVFDEACSSAGVSHGDHFIAMITLNLNVDYLRAAEPNRTYLVFAEIVHAGRSRLLANSTIRADDGLLVAQARATLMPNRDLSAGVDPATRLSELAIGHR